VRKGRAFGQKALSSSSLHGKQRRRAPGAGGLGPAALGFSGGHREGQKGVRAMGNPLPAPIWAGAQ